MEQFCNKSRLMISRAFIKFRSATSQKVDQSQATLLVWYLHAHLHMLLALLLSLMSKIQFQNKYPFRLLRFRKYQVQV